MAKKRDKFDFDVEMTPLPSSAPPLKNRRETWKNSVEFFLAILGLSVGMGTLTKFPYVLFKNGGGAFLIPFILVLIIAGIPLFYLELILGQFSGRSPLTLWVLVPAFKGIGYSMTALTLVASIYYMPFTWSVVYLFSSFTGLEVPWKSCGHEWNTPRCYDKFQDNASLNNYSTTITTTANASITRISPAEEFFNEYVLGVTTNGIGYLGSIQWHVLLAHLITWVMVYLCCFKGHVSAGKVVYVTATLPYLLLTVLLIRGVTLPGSLDGIIFFLKPDLAKLATTDVWVEAAIQVVFQLGPAWGSIITLSRYNDFHYRCHREAVIIPLTNLFTAIYGGLAVFSVLGFMAHRQGVPVAEIAKSGPGLAFIAYPEAIAQLPFPPIWAVVFFLVLITVAIDSQFAFFETIVSGFTDMYPTFKRYKIWVSLVFAIFLFLLGTPLCTQGGVYFFQLLDWYGAIFTFVCIGFLESIAIAYIYGLKRFRYDASLMFGKPPSTLVTVAWFSATPLLMAVMTFFGLSNYKAPRYDYTDYDYPQWAIAIAWLIGISSFMPTPILFVIVFARAKGGLLKRLRTIFQASDEWVPSKPELVDDYRRRWYASPSNNDAVSGGGVETVSSDGFDDDGTFGSSCNNNKPIKRLRHYVFDTFLRTSYDSNSDGKSSSIAVVGCETELHPEPEQEELIDGDGSNDENNNNNNDIGS